ncbi:TPA: hypothetical protein RQJ89_004176 [Vibrio vulnificus]|uniref:hypothetical protein n=1 Tax=Vibrio vulnificus TaxID=672 RepID=UPI00102380FE|nr:hypothetical protein [Vibrio vulnificus]RZP59838.1 hypothetical protein D8T45_19140 [Vibrio vulnificus]RZR08414.1 hypothetical protein D8T24_21645 [Vibrio vulnificus]HDY7666938.1 hypothetical protein [Vibrio vulnificus]HDY7672389.1 hypothetical protein [Vibrio vulnificus]
MKYKLPNTNESYIPRVHEFLVNLPQESLHYREYDLIHPADVYMTVFDEVIANGTRLLQELESMENQVLKRKGKHMNSLVLGFLFSISNYIDGCLSIIKSTFPPKSKEVGKTTRTFKAKNKEYIDYVNKKVNYIKHRHRTISTILSSWDNEFIVGYFVQGWVEEGKLGPEPDIHEDPNCAISLNWDISYHIYHVYELAVSLNVILAEAITSSTKAKYPDLGSSEYIEFFDLASKLKKNLHPDEFSKKQANVKSLGGNKFELEYPSKVKPLNRKPHTMTVTFTSKLGVSSDSIVTPYRVLKDYRKK